MNNSSIMYSMLYNNSIVEHGNSNTMDYKGLFWRLGVISVVIAGVYGASLYINQQMKNAQNKAEELQNESSRCSEEAEIIGSEIEIITAALNDFNQQAISLNRDLSGQPGFFHVATEQTALLEPVDRRNRVQLLSELRELMGYYPKWQCEGELTLEYLQLYSAERLEHHEKIKSIALVLLPELNDLLREGRSIGIIMHKN